MTVNGQTAGPAQSISFCDTGAVNSANGGVLSFPDFAPGTGATSPQPMTFNFGQSTQFGGGFGVT